MTKALESAYKWWNANTTSEKDLYTKIVFGQKKSYKRLRDQEILKMHRENSNKPFNKRK